MNKQLFWAGINIVSLAMIFAGACMKKKKE